MTTTGRNVKRLRRARSLMVGARSRVSSFLTRAASARVPERFGGLRWLSVAAIVLLALQMATGALLSLYYYPEPGAAYESTRFITTDVPVGWLIRSMHHWAGELLLVTVILHLLVVFIGRRYRAPREYEWMLGVLMLCTILVFRFTGRLLPWDTIGHAATQGGLQLIESVPVFGKFIAWWLRGGEVLGANTLSRFFTTHVVLLPWLVVALLVGHMLLLRRHGLSGDDR
jgi:quinol-cytochrome oxidoreductase complex cytochrome b subunit